MFWQIAPASSTPNASRVTPDITVVRLAAHTWWPGVTVRIRAVGINGGPLVKIGVACCYAGGVEWIRCTRRRVLGVTNSKRRCVACLRRFSVGDVEGIGRRGGVVRRGVVLARELRAGGVGRCALGEVDLGQAGEILLAAACR